MALTPRPGIMEIPLYIGGKGKLDGVEKPILLASNESPLGPSPRAIEAYRAAGERLNRYPDGGSTDLRAAIAKHHGLDASRIICTNGSDELITMIARAYAGPGDEVIFCEHGFAMYPIATLSVGATPVVARERDLTADVDAILDCVTAKTRIVFLANPNNPTGTFITADAVARLRAGLPGNVLLVIDAAYAEYVARNDYSAGVELVEAGDNVVMTRTFSKAYALAGVRLGWAYCPKGVWEVLNRLRGPFNVGVPAQAAGVAALDDMAHLDAARTHNDLWRPWFAAALEKLGLTVHPSVANFLLVKFPDDPKRNAAAANAFLNARGIIVRPVDNYGLPGCLRFTVGLEDECRAVVAALEDFLG